jgi:hypothetical protein
LTLVLLDTNAYLRLAKRIRPMLGMKFGQKEYVLTICRVCLKEDGVLHGYELLAKMLTAKLIDTIIRTGGAGFTCCPEVSRIVR